MYFIPIFIAVYAGADAVQAIVNVIPAWLTSGLNVASKLLTAYGLALLLSLMLNKGMIAFLFLGFMLASYLQLSVIAVSGFGVILAVILASLHGGTPGLATAVAPDVDYDPLEDDE